MRIKSFEIRNYRNIRYARHEDIPDFIVIGGGNGCGKSALLEAFFFAKQAAAPYRNQAFRLGGRNVVSADADLAIVNLEIEFSEVDREFASEHLKVDCPEVAKLEAQFRQGQATATGSCPGPVRRLLSSYRSVDNPPGFFDYFTARRQIQTQTLTSLNFNQFNHDQIMNSFQGSGNKFNFTKQYLAKKKVEQLEELESKVQSGEPTDDFLALPEIKKFFDSFFAPMEFEGVKIGGPVTVDISTPTGTIDIDDLSSGEKEIFHTFVRFRQLNPDGAIILFDEPDVHLHPDFARRYVDVLKKAGKGNQLWITTHSPDMMMEAGAEHLFTVEKTPSECGKSQFVQVATDSHLYDLLKETIGTRGIVTLGKKIVFIEGTNTSADLAIYEAAYPSSMYNVSFVPSGNSTGVSNVSEKVQEILTQSTSGFQEFYCIVDGDIHIARPRAIEEDKSRRLFRLPVYHVENFLLDPDHIFELTRSMLGVKCPFSSANDVEECLKDLLTQPSHLAAFAGALYAAEKDELTWQIRSAISQGDLEKIEQLASGFDFSDIHEEARMILIDAIDDGTWRCKCKGRDLLKAYCGLINQSYDTFRNLLIDRIQWNKEDLHAGLQEIMSQILSDRVPSSAAQA